MQDRSEIKFDWLILRTKTNSHNLNFRKFSSTPVTAFDN